ncbi:MAG: PAS domain-containing protein [Bacteroidales bacterium]|nr:PAS domain-containing protein [Bacteroidales bacterium]
MGKQQKKTSTSQKTLSDKKSKPPANSDAIEEVLLGIQAGTWSLDIPAGVVHHSQQWVSALGIDINDQAPSTFDTWKSLLHPDDITLVNQALDSIAKGQSDNLIAEIRIRHQQGHYLWITITAKVSRRADDGTPLQIQGVCQDISLRKITQMQLIERNELLNRMSAMARVGAWEFDTTTGKGSWTDEVARIHDLDPETETDKNLGASFYVGDSKKKINKAIQKAIEKGTPYDLELEMVTAKNKHKWVRTIAYPVVEKGRVVQIRGSFQDITDFKNSELRLKAQKTSIDLLHRATDAMAMVETYIDGLQKTLEEVCKTTGWDIGEVWEPDTAGNVLEFSEAWYTSDKKLRGFYDASKKYTFRPGSGLPGRAWKQKKTIWIPDVKTFRDFHRAKEARRFGLSSGVAIPIIAEKKVVNVIVFFMKKKQEEDSDFVKLISGIATQLGQLFIRKKTEESIKKLSLEYEKVFDGTQSAMFLVEYCADRIFRYVRTNRAYEQMSGYSHEDTYGKTPYDLFEERAADEITANYRKCIQTEKSVSFELDLEHRGKRHVVYVDLNPVKEHGVPKFIVGSSTDITDRILMMEELMIAKDKAEASDRLKAAFLNNISHEIRTPLNGILGFGQMLAAKGATASQQNSYLRSMEKSSKRLIDTIDKIVDISMLLSGSVQTAPENCSPEGVLHDVYEQMLIQSKEKDLTLVLDIPKHSKRLSINSDPELLRKALMHLLDNAIKFTDKGSIHLGLEKRSNAVVLFIKDTGKGIAPEYMEKIYEPFSQEDASMTRGYEGSGLGLPVASGIIKKLGGSIWFESKMDYGTTFFLSLPLSGEVTSTEDEAGENTRPEGDSASLAGTDQTIHTNKILIADDDEMTRFLMETLLEDLNVHVLVACDGRQAVDLFTENQDISLVIMDIKMPVMDGMEATRRIKAIRPEVPVIAVTAHAMSGDEHRIRQAGCDDYLSKPLSGKTLLEKIRALHSGLSLKR